MTFSVRGLSVAQGIAIGRAVLVGNSRMDVAHYFIEPHQVQGEFDRLRQARDAVLQELSKLQQTVTLMPRKEAPSELSAMLEVHMMLLNDEMLIEGVKSWVQDRHYNAEWALTAQLEQVSRQFDEMEDEYLRERKADLEQVVERVLRHMTGRAVMDMPVVLDDVGADSEAALILVAHDLSPADMLQFKQSVFAGFVTDVGGKTSHTAIVARSMGIPAVVGARLASTLIMQDDWVIIDGDAGICIVDPPSMVLDEYRHKQQQNQLNRTRLARLRNTPAVTLDGQKIQLMANIERPSDAAAALRAGAVGVGLFRSEFLFMGRHAKGLSKLPDEEEQFLAYKEVVEGMHGLPVTIRTVDIGADKVLERVSKEDFNPNLNPALGLRAIRWSLTEPEMFLTQLRAILRAAALGQIRLLIPMLCTRQEILQTLKLFEQAKQQLDKRAVAYGSVKLGAMIEVPAAALALDPFLQHFDFLSIGTNDLIQYTLAIDRADEAVAHYYDPLHPAVLSLIANTIAKAIEHNKEVSVCGEMAGDVAMTRLLLGLGLRSFSMHPAQILSVKQEVLRADTTQLADLARTVLESANPAQVLEDSAQIFTVTSVTRSTSTS